MRHRQNELFNSSIDNSKTKTDFSKIRVGVKTLEDAIVDVNPYKQLNGSSLGDKETVMKALARRDSAAVRKISNYFFDTSGIYAHACRYLASLYRYDWYIIPYINDLDKANENKILKEFARLLEFFDNSNIKLLCDEEARKLIVDGCYYGYILKSTDHIQIQDLPVEYCRSRFKKGNIPVVEFKMKYFDEKFTDVGYRMKILKLFPDEFAKGYMLYKQGKLKPDYNGDESGWYMLDPKLAFKLSLNDSDMPLLANAIPSIIDLAEAKELDRKKVMQKLLKIIIQKMPLDKNGDLVFDLEETRELHNNAVSMVKKAINVDVLTTFADTEVANLSDNNTATTSDDLERVERGVYNDFGFSENLFNSTGNTALEKSTLVDEASIRMIPLTFSAFFNRVLRLVSPTNKKYHFNFKMLETTQFNYRDLSKLYKDQVQIGYSKMLPQIALGHSQSEILAMANFENKIIKLSEIMIPPMSSNTMSGKGGSTTAQTQKAAGAQKIVDSDAAKGGRPELDDNQKSDKTIANLEAKG